MFVASQVLLFANFSCVTIDFVFYNYFYSLGSYELQIGFEFFDNEAETVESGIVRSLQT